MEALKRAHCALLGQAASYQKSEGKALSLYYRGAILNRLGRYDQARASLDQALTERDQQLCVGVRRPDAQKSDHRNPGRLLRKRRRRPLHQSVAIGSRTNLFRQVGGLGEIRRRAERIGVGEHDVRGAILSDDAKPANRQPCGRFVEQRPDAVDQRVIAFHDLR